MLQVSKEALLKRKLKKTVVSPATTPTPANIPTSMDFGGFDANATPSCYETQTRSIQTTPPTPRSKGNGASIHHDAAQLEVTTFMGELKLPIVCRPFRRSSARLLVFACSWLLFLPLLPPRASTCGPDEDKKCFLRVADQRKLRCRLTTSNTPTRASDFFELSSTRFSVSKPTGWRARVVAPASRGGPLFVCFLTGTIWSAGRGPPPRSHSGGPLPAGPQGAPGPSLPARRRH